MKVAQSCLTLCNPVDYIIHGILQVRIMVWVAFSIFRGSSQPRSSALQADSFPAEPQAKPLVIPLIALRGKYHPLTPFCIESFDLAPNHSAEPGFKPTQSVLLTNNLLFLFVKSLTIYASNQCVTFALQN